jgi:cell wall-associated NlpC family hydrolase
MEGGGSVGDYGAADEIAKLADLRQRGLLSETEFEEQRKRILVGTKPERKHRVPALAVLSAVIVAVALAVGLFAGVSSGPKAKSAGNNTVHLSLASETSADSAAVAWAKSLVNTSQYGDACLAFVIDAYQKGADWPIRSHITFTVGNNTYPSQVWDHFSGGTTGGPNTTAPVGALFFWNNTHGYTLSHVAISLGNNNFISTSDADSSGIHYETMAQFDKNSWAEPLGWWLPDGSNARPPAVAAPTTPPTAKPLQVSSGSSGAPAGASALQPASGSSTLQPASGASSLQPASGSSSLGSGSSVSPPSGGSSTPPATTPPATTPPATTPPATTPPATTPPTSPPAPRTYAETVGGVSHTWTDYADAGGTEGPSIASNQSVQIACKVTGFKVADGNTWWYRIASSPWNNQYYVSADAFYNNGETSGSLHGTPFVDPAVPNC